MMKWFRRSVIALIAVVVLLPVMGASYQSMAVARDNNQHPPLGILVDVGGYNLHIYCVGTGSPTTIIDSGTGTWSLMWLHLMPDLAQRTRTCVYDRAGYGWSESSGRPHTAENSAEDLYNLLTNADIQPPYVLVGHSYGGYVIRVYHDQHPDNVVGMILAESGHPEQWDRLPEVFIETANAQAAPLTMLGRLAPFGLARMLVPDDPYLDAEYQPVFRAAMGLQRSYEAFASEFENAEISSQQTANLRGLGDKPLAVISAYHSLQAFDVLDASLPFEEGNIVWRDMQQEFATKSTNSIHLVSETADHYIHSTDPQLVLDGIDWVLNQLSGSN